jgi:hypothetical protein
MIRFSTRLSPEAKFYFRNFRLKLFGDISMPTIQSRNYPGERQSTTTEFTATIQLLRNAAREAGQGRGRFEIYKLLRTVHRVHIGWKQRRSAKMSARALAADLSITLRRGMSPIGSSSRRDCRKPTSNRRAGGCVRWSMLLKMSPPRHSGSFFANMAD